jgi:siderophore ferric iron reductase
MMINLTQPQPLTPMLDLCRQVIPYLDGKFEQVKATLSAYSSTDEWLIGQPQDAATIQALIHDLKLQYPEAGQAYYLARAWQLLCWQPIYIAFISLYGLKQLPDFSHFQQHRQHRSIVGFIFTNNRVVTDDIEKLIPLAAAQLSTLLAHYRHHLDELYRCRPGFANGFTADVIIDNLLKVKQFIPGFDEQQLKQHAQWWFQGMGLPQKLMGSLIEDNNMPITVIRNSCCLAYKIDKGLCENCPKQHKKTLNIMK